MHFISRYNGIDGDHHQKWLVDQVARALKGTPAIVKLAKWDNGHLELRVSLDEPSQEYKDWVEEILERDEDGDPQCDYDVGIAP